MSLRFVKVWPNHFSFGLSRVKLADCGWFSCAPSTDLFFLRFRFVQAFVLSSPSVKPGHLTSLTSAWLTCKCMDAIFSKLQPHCEQLSRTWNSESGLKELSVVRCCYMIRVSHSFLVFHARRHENHLVLSKLVAPRKSFCGCLNFREIISMWRPFLGFH